MIVSTEKFLSNFCFFIFGGPPIIIKSLCCGFVEQLTTANLSNFAVYAVYEEFHGLLALTLTPLIFLCLI